MNDSIIEKINNNTFNFTSDEKEVLSHTPELFNLFIKKFVDNPSLLNAETTELVINLADDSQEYVEALINSDLLYLVILYNIEHNGELYDDDTLGYLSPEHRESCLVKLREQIKSGNVKSYFLSATILRIILEEKRYDLFDNFHSFSSDIPEDLTQMLIEYINSNDNIPSIFGEFCENMDLPYEKFPLSKLLDMYSNNSYQGSDEDFCKLIVNRINASSNLNNMKINMRLFRKAGYDLGDVNLEKQIVEALLARKNVSYYIEEISEATYRALQSRIYETVKDKDSYVDFIVGSGVSSRYVEEDSELICSLIEGGHSDLAVKSRIFERCVIENIDRLKEPISEFIRNNNDYYSSAREDLLSALSQIPSFNDYFYEFLNNNNGNITLNDNYFTNSKILDRLISENKAETFKNVLLKSDLSNAYSNVKIFEGTPDFQEYLINQLNTDSIFCDKFFGKQKYWILRSEYMTNYYMSVNGSYCKKVLDLYNHQEEEEVVYTKVMYENFKKLLLNEYNITKVDHLDFLADKFGYDILRFIESTSIQSIINFDDEDFNRVIDLFATEYTYNDALSYFDSLNQHQFYKEYPEIINRFADIKNAIFDGRVSEIHLTDIIYSIDENFYKKNPSLAEVKGRENEYLYGLIYKIASKTLPEEESDEYLTIIRTYVNYYIAKKREDHRSESNFEDDCSVPYEFDQKALRAAYIKHVLLTEKSGEIQDILINKYGLSFIESNDLISFYLGRAIYIDDLNEGFRLSPEEYEEKRNQYINTLKKKIKLLISAANDYIDEHDIKIDDYYGDIYHVKKNYQYSGKNNIFKVLSELDPTLIKDRLLSEDRKEEYELLRSTMKKYKLNMIPGYFNNLLEKVDLSCDASDIASFINYFYKILEKEKKERKRDGISTDNISFTLINALNKAAIFASASSVYSQILTPENFRLIKSNPGPNAASGIKSFERITKAVEKTRTCFERTKTHVPSFNEVVSFKSGDGIKQLRVVVGNFTSPVNITHGERTGACMRIGGAGRTLFDFCLDNEFGFHIRFEDPETGEYISRVSGFRNGNSVFLNELRDSCNMDKYSNQDVISACRVASELMIKLSMNSKSSISNVFVHRAYAMKEDKECPKISFNGVNIKTGLPTFYSDIQSEGLLLASSKMPPEEVKVSTDLPEYAPAREIAYEGNNKNKLVNMINRVSGVKELLSGAELSFIERVVDETDVEYGVVSDDFYIYVDKDGVVHEDFIDRDERVTKEMESAREKIKAYLESKKLPSLSDLTPEVVEIVTEVPSQGQAVTLEESGGFTL